MTARSCPASTPACTTAACCPPNTWSTAATPPCPTWNKPHVTTRSPSPGRSGATPPGNTVEARASPGTTSTSTTTAGRSPAPQGQVSQGWHGPYPTSSPTAAPLIVARFAKSQCHPCPARAQCTTSRESTRTVGFPPRELRDLQTPRPCRATDSRVEEPLRGPLRSGGNGQRVRPRPRHAPLPLPRTEQSTRPAHPDGHRHQRRASQRSPTDRGSAPSPPADRPPEPPRPARDPSAKFLAHPGHLTSATPRSPTESS